MGTVVTLAVLVNIGPTKELFGDVAAVLADVPQELGIGWAIWLTVGLVLSMWGRHASAAADHYQPAVVSKPAPRPKSAVRPAVRPPSGTGITPARPKPAPAVVGDPFGDLERVFEEQAAQHRLPGDSPILNSAGSPVLRANEPSATDRTDFK